MATVKVLIGRFQPFHSGHAALIQRALTTADLVVVLVGSAHQARSLENPFTADERAGVIRAWAASLPGRGQLEVLPIRDQRYNNAKWLQTADELVQGAIARAAGIPPGPHQILLTGSDRDRTTWYLKAFPQWGRDLVPEQTVEGAQVSGTILRELMFGGPDMDTAERVRGLVGLGRLPTATQAFLSSFVAGHHFARLRRRWVACRNYQAAWANSPYPPTFITADAVVIQSGHVLTVIRGGEAKEGEISVLGEGECAHAGGFLDPTERVIDCAIRELQQETNIELTEGTLRSAIKAKEIFDDPSRSERGRTVSVAFLLRLDDSRPLAKVHAGSDAKRVEWTLLSEARANPQNWFEDHSDMTDWAVGFSDMR
jgi:bifunctional NMN adenylyltransferase/nudix hydrolase